MSTLRLNTLQLAADFRYWLDREAETRGRDRVAHAAALESLRSARAQFANAALNDVGADAAEILRQRGQRREETP